MPVIEGGHDDQVPPVVRMPNEVHLAGEPALRNLGRIENEGDEAEQVHDHNAGHHQLQSVIDDGLANDKIP